MAKFLTALERANWAAGSAIVGALINQRLNDKIQADHKLQCRQLVGELQRELCEARREYLSKESECLSNHIPRPPYDENEDPRGPELVGHSEAAEWAVAGL